jgi:hypothetical protein
MTPRVVQSGGSRQALKMRLFSGNWRHQNVESVFKFTCDDTSRPHEHAGALPGPHH